MKNATRVYRLNEKENMWTLELIKEDNNMLAANESYYIT